MVDGGGGGGLSVVVYEVSIYYLLLIALECCHPLPSKIGVLIARGGSTLEQWIICAVKNRRANWRLI